MNSKYLIFGAVIVALFAGALMAIQGATTNNVATSGVNQVRWAGASASSNATQGGNISIQNLTVISLTSRWAVYYGNVTGSIILSTSSGGSQIYEWNPATIAGTVCASTGSANTFLSPANASAATLDTRWGFTGATDAAVNTQNKSNCSLILSTGTLTQISSWYHMGNSTFYTCAITTDGATLKNNFAFCTNISSAGRYFGSAIASNTNYELMVPTVAGAVETYYFYAELA